MGRTVLSERPQYSENSVHRDAVDTYLKRHGAEARRHRAQVRAMHDRALKIADAIGLCDGYCIALEKLGSHSHSADAVDIALDDVDFVLPCGGTYRSVLEELAAQEAMLESGDRDRYEIMLCQYSDDTYEQELKTFDEFYVDLEGYCLYCDDEIPVGETFCGTCGGF